ncbi:MAG TPA: acetyl-CoA carboxylase biotin carboxyl carrier protein [Candidatus Krumholzibacteria bacterium]|jgi:acetyl-CoA carboxylase biotin carboxyl carrier protein
MELDKIRELVKLVEESQIQELELGNRGETIRISKGGAAVVAPAQAPIVPAPVQGAPAAPAEGAPPVPAAVSTLRELASPMVGTFYRGPSPDAEVFVKTGDQVRAGDVLCIVEAMKVMNEIEAEFAGSVREILVEDGQPVEFGQALFLIEPN